MLEGHPVEKLHRDEKLIAMLSDLVDRANIWMIQSGCSSRFTAKALERLRITGKLIGKEFQCDEPAEFRILSLVNHTHTATAKFLDDSVVQNVFADGPAGGGHVPGMVGRGATAGQSQLASFCACGVEVGRAHRFRD